MYVQSMRTKAFLPQSPVPHHANNNQHVAKDRGQNDKDYKKSLKQCKHDTLHIVVPYQRGGVAGGCGVRRQIGGIKIGIVFVNSNKFNENITTVC